MQADSNLNLGFDDRAKVVVMKLSSPAKTVHSLLFFRKIVGISLPLLTLWLQAAILALYVPSLAWTPAWG